MSFYHVEINSFYVEIVRIRYIGKDYKTMSLKYYSKSSGDIIATERNVKVMNESFEHWETYHGNK